LHRSIIRCQLSYQFKNLLNHCAAVIICFVIPSSVSVIDSFSSFWNPFSFEDTRNNVSMERVETAETRRIFSFQTFTDYQARNIRSGGHYSGSVRIEAQITKVVYQMPRLNKKK
jgi:hypothetical protein